MRQNCGLVSPLGQFTSAHTMTAPVGPELGISFHGKYRTQKTDEHKGCTFDLWTLSEL